MKMAPEQFAMIKAQLERLMEIPDGFYAKKFAGIDIASICSMTQLSLDEVEQL